VPLRCLLIGRGLQPDNRELFALIRDSGCEDLATSLGSRSDIEDLARAMDLHVLPSCSEAFPNVIAETMLCGTPNAVTDVGDSAFMVGEAGWIVPPGDSDKLAEAIEQAYREWRDRPDRWQVRRAASRQSIVDRFTFEQMADAYRRIWAEVSERAGSLPLIASRFEGP
jgi:glycosyltransferase involved in cell wall biosynthesis